MVPRSMPIDDSQNQNCNLLHLSSTVPSIIASKVGSPALEEPDGQTQSPLPWEKVGSKKQRETQFFALEKFDKNHQPTINIKSFAMEKLDQHPLCVTLRQRRGR